MQHSLWQDGYTVLQVDTGAIGQTRLRRFLNWLDTEGFDWTEPHLEAYTRHMRDTLKLSASSIHQNISALRNHYLAILTNPENYDHIPLEERSAVVDMILEQLGFNTDSISYHHLTNSDDDFMSDNMHMLLLPGSHRYRDTQITAFVHWLDKTERHWTAPALLDYKAYLLEDCDLPPEVASNALTAIRRRYYDLIEDGTLLKVLSDDQRQEFLDDLRRNLGYLDQFPSRAMPTREMLEDDPYHKNYLSQAQVTSLLSKPDLSTFVGVRDRALIGVAVVTGIQQSELAGLEVSHLRQAYQGRLALQVTATQHRAERCIPYDDEWVLDWVDAWLDLAEIEEGAIFRGTYGNRDVLRPHAIAPETASDILARYPIEMYGAEVPLLFADLRATCARRWYEQGVAFDEIERRLAIHSRRVLLKLLGVRVRRVYG